jgi:hypothetical protein
MAWSNIHLPFILYDSPWLIAEELPLLVYPSVRRASFSEKSGGHRHHVLSTICLQIINARIFFIILTTWPFPFSRFCSMHRNNMLKICHTFEVVGGPDTGDHLCSRRHIPLPPGEAEDKSRGSAELSKGRVAVRFIGAEAELESGAGAKAPDPGDGGDAAEGAGRAGG